MTDLHRRAILTFAALLAVAPVAALAAPKPPVVLFVCPAGTAKSPIARELFRKRAKERGIAVTALSRGLHIEDHVSPPLRQRLDAEGIDTRRDGFAVLAPKDARAADVVVAFAPLPATYSSSKLRDWSAVPSVNENWPVARADIDRRIEALLDALVAAKGRKPR
jgi:Low molecular weight phosphotyrosine protein phosphatase